MGRWVWKRQGKRVHGVIRKEGMCECIWVNRETRGGSKLLEIGEYDVHVVRL